MIKIVKITTVPISLKILLKGQLKYLSENNFEVHCISANGKEIEDLYLYESIKKHYSIRLFRAISPFNDLIAIWQCYKILKDIKPEIVHTYTPKAGLVGMIASYLAGVKIRMHNVTGLPLILKTGLIKKILIIVEKMIHSFATDTYVNSFGLKNYINKYISNEVEILGSGSTNGIDQHYFKKTDLISLESEKIKKTYGITDKEFIWIFIGRIVKDKGIIELILAFESFSKNYNTKLLIVGSFEQELDPIPEIYVNKIKNNPNIILVGYQNDVRPFLNLSDCLVFPSHREGLPNVPMQAACFGLPIIATDINGCNEIVTDNVNGILVPAKDYLILTEALTNMYLNENFRERCSSITRKKILDKFEQMHVWFNLKNEYLEKLQKKCI